MLAASTKVPGRLHLTFFFFLIIIYLKCRLQNTQDFRSSGVEKHLQICTCKSKVLRAPESYWYEKQGE